MKKHHTNIALAVIFCTGLIVVWWAGNTDVDRDLTDAVLPTLAKVPAADIKRLEIVRPKTEQESKDATPPASTSAERIIVERRDEGRWQILEPFDAAADPSLVETLAQNLKGLRKSIDAGTIHDPSKNFGLSPEAATIVRVYGSDRKTPLATLDVGRSLRDQLYVLPEGSTGIEVIDPRLLGMLKLPPAQWRDRALFHMPSFRVGALTVTGPGRDFKVERDESQWRLVRPLRAVAEDEKVEGIVAELTSLQVVAKDAGFVANDVKNKDAAKYGLDQPAMTIELRPAFGSGKPQTLLVGKPESEQSDRHFARTGDQDDVVLIDAKNLRNLGLDTKEVRSKKVADLNDARVEFIRIEAFGRTYDIVRATSGWEQLQPSREPADTAAVQNLLKRLGEAQTSEFLEAAGVPHSGIDPPQMTLSVWQAAPQTRPALGLDAPPKTAPRVVLQIGRHDVLRKLVYARLEGDTSLLAIPDALADALPQSPLAFRDRTVLELNPSQVLRLTIHRNGTAYELAAPTESGKSIHWQMVRPVSANADQEAATKVLMVLSSLHADQYITDQIGDGKAFGLHAPVLTVTWTTPAVGGADKTKEKEKAKASEKEKETRTATLRIGAKLPKSDLYYANVEGSPEVFTLPSRAVEVFEAELHTKRVMTFKAGAARRLVVHWPGLTVAFKPQENPAGQGMQWVPEQVSDAKSFDASRLGSLVGSLANLNTPKFIQYAGPIPADTGLDQPRLVIEVHVGDKDSKPHVLRIGRTSDEQAYATTTPQGEASGPVFLLTGVAWSDLVRHVPGGETLPEDVFAPEPGKPAHGEARPRLGDKLQSLRPRAPVRFRSSLVLRIVPYPHPALRYESRPVSQIDDDLRAKVRAMFDLMYASRGVGLAANQVAIPYQFFILNLTADPEQKDEERVFINPEIVKRHSSIEEEEGCLSFPSLYFKVKRARKIKLRAFDLTGNAIEVDADDLLSRALQHETDHLSGRLYIDLLGPTRPASIQGKLRELETSFQQAQASGEYPPDDEIIRMLDNL